LEHDLFSLITSNLISGLISEVCVQSVNC